MTISLLDEKLKQLGKSFEPFLTASNPNVVASLKKLGHNEDEIRRIELFDWFQGVGLYGYYELYKSTEDVRYLKIMLEYFNVRINDGLPNKNINSMAPMLTLISLLDDGMVGIEHEEAYWDTVKQWANWLYNEAPRTEGGGFSHLTCEAANAQELWDDTLFMAVLFLGKAGVVLDKEVYVEEAMLQFLIHNQYLQDKQTGFWFHGYTFDGNHNFVNARWARGNSWITIFVPIFLEICKDYPLSVAIERMLKESWLRQVNGLIAVQNSDGLWPTLLDDPSSYSEASATAGFVWGIQKGREMSLLKSDDKLKNSMDKAVKALLNNINDDGILEQVSGGTAMGKNSLDFYRNIPLVPKPYGQAMAMGALAATMMLKMEE